MATRVPERFTLTASALEVIRTLVGQDEVAYVLRVRTVSPDGPEGDSEGWEVFAIREGECGKPVEFCGLRFLFNPLTEGELVGKELDWVESQGFVVNNRPLVA